MSVKGEEPTEQLGGAEERREGMRGVKGMQGWRVCGECVEVCVEVCV